jgi:hypothetical protein
MKIGQVIPESWLKCMTKEDRASFGKGGMTAAEALEKFTAKNERQLQSQIVSLLRLKGIEVLWHRTDKKSAATIGWPDLTFSVMNKHLQMWACVWEVKLPEGKMSEAQVQMADNLTRVPNRWNHKVIRSVQEALKELRSMGIE